MSKKCYPADEIIAFAMDPLKEENAPIAAHILNCPHCREEHQLALEAIKQDEVPIFEQDRSDAGEAVRKYNETAAETIRFGAVLEKLCKQLGSISNLFSSISSAAPQSAAPVFGVASMRTQSNVNMAAPTMATPRITFESCCTADSKYYWKMEMVLPLNINSLSRVSLKVSDAEKQLINQCLLRFLGQDIQITGGTASLPLKVFSENVRVNSVEVTFSDGVVSPGKIKFLSESLA